MEDKLKERVEPVKAADGERESDNRKSRRKQQAFDRKVDDILDDHAADVKRREVINAPAKTGKSEASAAYAIAAGAAVIMAAAGADLAQDRVEFPVDWKDPTDYSGDIPDRVSINPKSRFYFPRYRGLGVKISGYVRKADVEEFCVSEGWAMVRIPDARGRFKTERGKFLTQKIKGIIEPFWQGK